MSAAKASSRGATTDIEFFTSTKSTKNRSAASSGKGKLTTRTTKLSPSITSSRTPKSTNSSTPTTSIVSSPLTSPASSPPPTKRKSTSPAGVEPNAALPREVKRLRTAGAIAKPRKRTSAASSKVPSRASSHQHTLAPSPEPIYRVDRSRSTSLFPYPGLDTPIEQRIWRCLGDGTPSPEHLSSEKVVTRLIKSYKAYFKNPCNPSDESFLPKNMPTAELEYPNNGAVERFLLLAPKDKDHYNPIMDLEKSLYTLIEFYLTPDQQALFGTLPNETLSEALSPPPSRSPSPPNSQASIVSNASNKSSSSLSSLSSLSSKLSDTTKPFPLLRAVQRAIHTQDGPLFLRALSQINELIRKLKYPETPYERPEAPSCSSSSGAQHSSPSSHASSPCPDEPSSSPSYCSNDLFSIISPLSSIPSTSSTTPSSSLTSSSPSPLSSLSPPPATNPLMQMVDTWTSTGLPTKVLMRILEENYQRHVGPNVASLKQYEAFSSTVYGELMPSLSHEIISITGLTSSSLFLDLGSGVANVVVQAALQTGCRAFGVELMPHPARVAREAVKGLEDRCRMWGVRMGEVELEEGDMLKSRKVDELMSKADVVLVDNKVFEESLNEALKPIFLDLKEGAIVISLAPFVSSLNARVTERNVDDISAIFEVTERPYHSGSVSWGNNGGNYYIHRVDREGYAKIRERFFEKNGGADGILTGAGSRRSSRRRG